MKRIILAVLLLLAITAAPVAALEPDAAQWESDGTSHRVQGSTRQGQLFDVTKTGKLTRLMLRVTVEGNVTTPLTVTVGLGSWPSEPIATVIVPRAAFAAYPASRFVKVDVPPGVKVGPNTIYTIVLSAPELSGGNAYRWFGAHGEPYPAWGSFQVAGNASASHGDFDFAFRTYVRERAA